MKYAKTVAKTKSLGKAAPKNSYLPTAGVCRIELNTIFLPFFTFGSFMGKNKFGQDVLIKVGSTEGIVRKNVMIDGKKIDYNISFDADHGRPGEQDFLLFRKVEEIAVGYITRDEAIPEYMYIGTAQSLIKNLKISEVQKFLARITGARIRGEAVFFQADGGTDDATKKAKGKLIKCDEGVSLYDGSRIVSKVEGKSINSNNDCDVVGIYVKLSDYYKTNLSNYYTKSVFGKYMHNLDKGISRRILEILLLKDMKEDVYINYSTLCDLLQIKLNTSQWKMKNQIEERIAELEEKKIIIWKNHKNPKKINGGTDWQLIFSLRPLMTPLQRRRQIDFDGNMKETEITNALKRKDEIRAKTNKILKTSPLEDMVADAMVEEAANTNKIKLNKLSNVQVKAIIKSKQNKQSPSKIECYDKHRIPKDAVLTPPPAPTPTPVSKPTIETDADYWIPY